MGYNLFLDDMRDPKDCRYYPGDESEYDIGQWVTVRSFDDFKNALETKGIPKLISFDYDLKSNKDGLDCATFLYDFCKEHNAEVPQYLVHSAWSGIKSKFYEILN